MPFIPFCMLDFHDTSLCSIPCPVRILYSIQTIFICNLVPQRIYGCLLHIFLLHIFIFFHLISLQFIPTAILPVVFIHACIYVSLPLACTLTHILLPCSPSFSPLDVLAARIFSTVYLFLDWSLKRQEISTKNLCRVLALEVAVHIDAVFHS